MQRLLDLLPDVRNTDDLLDLEHRLGPFDEEDAVDARALFLLAAFRCRLAHGPAPSPGAYALIRPAPAGGVERLEVRGRMGNRIVRIVWIDGALYGSLHALRRLGLRGADFVDAESARLRIRGVLDEVIEETRPVVFA